MSKKIIVKIESYLSDTTWLNCGGQHLFEESDGLSVWAKSVLTKMQEGGKCMYAIVDIERPDNPIIERYGLATREEAEAAIEAQKTLTHVHKQTDANIRHAPICEDIEKAQGFGIECDCWCHKGQK